MRTRLLILTLLFVTGVNAANTRTENASTVTSSLTVGANVDYVLSSSTPFSAQGSINIPASAKEHSVVIFSRLKPSVVKANWLKYVKIDGSAAVDGTNCQVRMYNKGAIVLPYGSGFKPLTCYTGEDFTGTSCDSYTTGHSGGFMKTLDENMLINNFKSFKLKRGYMVTFATGTAGWGYSRCFIAAYEDLEVNLPAVLSGKVSSYRLFEWYNFGKTGIANNTDAAVCNGLNVQSAYSYGLGWDMRPDVECIPHKIQKWWPGVGECGSCEYSAHMKTDNEPANASDDNPATVAEVLGYWQDAMRTGMRLCAPSSHDNGYAWQEEFMNAIDARGWRCDILDMHCYWVTGSFNSLENYYNKFHRPIWVTEWLWGASWNSNGAFGGGVTDAKIQSNTRDILNMMNGDGYVERYHYWNSESKAKIYNDGVTALGQIYAATDGGVGYKPEYEFVPVVVMAKPYGISGSISSNSVSLNWEDANGDMMDEIQVQYKREGDASWNTLTTVSRKDKTGSGNQSYSFSMVFAGADGYTWRVADVFDGEVYASDALTHETELNDNATSLPSNLSDFYFQFYSKEAASNLVWAVHPSGEDRVYYKYASSNYGGDPYQLWTLESNSYGGYSLRNVGEPDYLICSPNSWNFVTRNNDYKVEAAQTAFAFVYYEDGDYWVCKNLRHNMYVGLWDNDKDFASGEVLAGNRTNPTGSDSGDKLGIRLIPRSMTVGVPVQPTISVGDYYLYNSESGLFIAAGGAWDTQAIAAPSGLAFTFTGDYTLDSNISNGGTAHYLGSNLYCDGQPYCWTFAKTDVVDGHQAYTISNDDGYIAAPATAGSTLTITADASSASAQWLLLTRADLIEKMESGTVSNPIDVTFLIPGHNFGRNDARIGNWSGSPSRGGYAQSDWGDLNAEKFNTTFDVYQEVTGVPDGVYEISMQGYYRCGGYNDAAAKRTAGNEKLNALLYGNDKTLPLPSIFEGAGSSKKMEGDVSTTHGYIPNGQDGASYYIHDGLYATGPLRFTVEGGSLRVGVRKSVAVANDWTLFDNFKLMYLGTGKSLPGDADGDGRVTVGDVTAIVNIILGKGGDYDQQAADVNGDGSVTVSDVTAVVNIILGKK